MKFKIFFAKFYSHEFGKNSRKSIKLNSVTPLTSPEPKSIILMSSESVVSKSLWR